MSVRKSRDPPDFEGRDLLVPGWRWGSRNCNSFNLLIPTPHFIVSHLFSFGQRNFSNKSVLRNSQSREVRHERFSIFLKLLSCFWLREGRCRLKQMRRLWENGPAASTRGQWVREPGHRPLLRAQQVLLEKCQQIMQYQSHLVSSGSIQTQLNQSPVFEVLNVQVLVNLHDVFLFSPGSSVLDLLSTASYVTSVLVRHKIPLPRNSVMFVHLHRKMNYSKNSHFETSVFFRVGLLFTWVNYNLKIVAVLWQRWGLLNFLSSSEHTKEEAVLIDASLL